MMQKQNSVRPTSGAKAIALDTRVQLEKFLVQLTIAFLSTGLGLALYQILFH
ncbi:MAG TPA: hypothetical protein VFN23_15015 [Ktedonobacteraceae bacterium]|nr:hypothetical protein [Ktedonobacteraceae bacterium]